MTRNIVLGNMYRTQVKAIKKGIAKVHEDLQYDYQDAFEALKEHKEYY